MRRHLRGQGHAPAACDAALSDWCWSTASIRRALRFRGLDAGVRVQTVREVLENGGNEVRADLLNTNISDNAMISLNAAMMTDGVLVTVAEQAAVSKPIQIVHVADPFRGGRLYALVFSTGQGRPRHLSRKFVRREDTKTYQVNDAVIIWIGEYAEPGTRPLNGRCNDAGTFSTAFFHKSVRTPVPHLQYERGGQVSRYPGLVAFVGEGRPRRNQCVSLLNGASIRTTLSDHGGCRIARAARFFRRGVDGSRTFVFQGRIIVAPRRRRPTPTMMTRHCCCADEPRPTTSLNSKFSTDDVTCGHGATTGALDAEPVFYLRAAGAFREGGPRRADPAFGGEAIESGSPMIPCANLRYWRLNATGGTS